MAQSDSCSPVARNDPTKYALFAGVLIASIGLVLVGCYSSEKGSRLLDSQTAPGAVTLDILEGGQPEHYWKYQVKPAGGSVHIIEEKTFPDYKHEDIEYTLGVGSGAIHGCGRNPQAISPDGKYVAYCTGEQWEFGVKDSASNTVVFRWLSGRNFSGRSIWGFAWAPNSKSVAVLNATGHRGVMPRDLLAFASGHPVSHDTIYLDFIDIAAGRRTEFLIRRDVVDPQIVRLLEWSQ